MLTVQAPRSSQTGASLQASRSSLRCRLALGARAAERGAHVGHVGEGPRATAGRPFARRREGRRAAGCPPGCPSCRAAPRRGARRPAPRGCPSTRARLHAVELLPIPSPRPRRCLDLLAFQLAARSPPARSPRDGRSRPRPRTRPRRRSSPWSGAHARRTALGGARDAAQDLLRVSRDLRVDLRVVATVLDLELQVSSLSRASDRSDAGTTVGRPTSRRAAGRLKAARAATASLDTRNPLARLHASLCARHRPAPGLGRPRGLHGSTSPPSPRSTRASRIYKLLAPCAGAVAP